LPTKSRISSSANCASQGRLRFQPANSGRDPQHSKHTTPRSRMVSSTIKLGHACRGECLAPHFASWRSPRLDCGMLFTSYQRWRYTAMPMLGGLEFLITCPLRCKVVAGACHSTPCVDRRGWYQAKPSCLRKLGTRRHRNSPILAVDWVSGKGMKSWRLPYLRSKLVAVNDMHFAANQDQTPV
jgi:hypothetical protein